MDNLEELKQELMETKNRCAEIEKKINELEKQTNEVRWRANSGEMYYYVCSSGEVDRSWDERGQTSTNHYILGNYFQTPKEAEKVAEKIKIYIQLKNLAWELNEGEEMDWEDDMQHRYYIYYSYEDNKLRCSSSCYFKDIGQIYCLDENFLEEAKKEIGEESLKKLFE